MEAAFGLMARRFQIKLAVDFAILTHTHIHRFFLRIGARHFHKLKYVTHRLASSLGAAISAARFLT